MTLNSSTAIARATGSPAITAHSTNHFIFQIFQRVLLLKTGMEINASPAHITIGRPVLLRATSPLGSGFSVNSFTPVSKRINRGPYKWCDRLYVTLVLKSVIMLKLEREKHCILVQSKRKLTSDAVTCLYTLVLDLGCEAGFNRSFKRDRKRHESLSGNLCSPLLTVMLLFYSALIGRYFNRSRKSI